MTSYTKEEQAANRAEWIAALRSGDYNQGVSQLRTGEQFCCLGVACEVAIGHGVTKRLRGGYAVDAADGSDYAEVCSLPYQVKDWLGLADVSGGLVDMESERFSLDGLNDGAGYTFEQLADVIESGKVKLA